MIWFYLTVAICLSLLTIVGGAVAFFTGLSDSDDELRNMGAIGIGPGTVVVWLWPVVLALVIPCFILYGFWLTARAVKHKSFDF